MQQDEDVDLKFTSSRWRIRFGLLDAVGAYLLLFAFSFAMIWVGVVLGSVVRTPEGVQGVTRCGSCSAIRTSQPSPVIRGRASTRRCTR